MLWAAAPLLLLCCSCCCCCCPATSLLLLLLLQQLAASALPLTYPCTPLIQLGCFRYRRLKASAPKPRASWFCYQLCRSHQVLALSRSLSAPTLGSHPGLSKVPQGSVCRFLRHFSPFLSALGLPACPPPIPPRSLSLRPCLAGCTPLSSPCQPQVAPLSGPSQPLRALSLSGLLSLRAFRGCQGTAMG